jgi:hypothetical protein
LSICLRSFSIPCDFTRFDAASSLPYALAKHPRSRPPPRNRPFASVCPQRFPWRGAPRRRRRFCRAVRRRRLGGKTRAISFRPISRSFIPYLARVSPQVSCIVSSAAPLAAARPRFAGHAIRHNNTEALRDLCMNSLTHLARPISLINRAALKGEVLIL